MRRLLGIRFLSLLKSSHFCYSCRIGSRSVGRTAAEHQNRSHPISSSEAVREAVRKWAQLQAGQKIFWSLYLQSLSATVVRCTALKEPPSGTRPSLSVSTKRQGYVINSRTVTFVSPNYFSFLSFCFGTFL